MRTGVLSELAPPLPPLPGVASNAARDFMEPSLIEPPSIQLPSIDHRAIVHPTMSIESIYLRTYNFIEPSSINNHFRTSIGSIIKQFRISEFAVAIQSVFEASESKVLNTREMMSAFRDEVTRAIAQVLCLG